MIRIYVFRIEVGVPFGKPLLVDWDSNPLGLHSSKLNLLKITHITPSVLTRVSVNSLIRISVCAKLTQRILVRRIRPLSAPTSKLSPQWRIKIK